MTFHKSMVYVGVLLIGVLGAVNSWADDTAVQCKDLFDATKNDQAVPVCFKAAEKGYRSAAFNLA